MLRVWSGFMFMFMAVGARDVKRVPIMQVGAIDELLRGFLRAIFGLRTCLLASPQG